MEDSIEKIDAVTTERARAALASMIESLPTIALYGPVSDVRPFEETAARLAA